MYFRHGYPDPVPVHPDGVHHDELRAGGAALRAQVPEGIGRPLLTCLVHLAHPLLISTLMRILVRHDNTVRLIPGTWKQCCRSFLVISAPLSWPCHHIGPLYLIPVIWFQWFVCWHSPAIWLVRCVSLPSDWPASWSCIAMYILIGQLPYCAIILRLYWPVQYIKKHWITVVRLVKLNSTVTM